MSNIFRVAVQYDNQVGYIEYDPATKQLEVKLPNEEKRQAAISFLTTKRVLRTPQQSLMNFKEWEAVPTENMESFEAALGRLWENTDVHIDWSRPV